MANSLQRVDRPTVRLIDAGVVAWLVLWLVVGIYTGVVIWRLSEVGDTVTHAGQSVSSTGSALQSLGSIPAIGDRPGQVGDELSSSGTDIQSRGQTVKGQLRQLSILLGLVIALVPTTPVLGLYLPLREGRRRHVRRIRRALASGGDADLDRFLAHQALSHLAYDAVRDADERQLADAELRRLGLARPTRPPSRP